MKAFCFLLFHGSFIFPKLEYVECSIIEFLLFVCTATLGGIILCAPECFSLCSYLLSGYTKRDVRSNEATMEYLFMDGASSSIMIKLQEIVNGLINTQMYNSLGILIALLSITVGIGFNISPTLFHQWTPDVYEGVHRCFSFCYLKVAASTLAIRIFDIPFFILSMILGNLIAITQTNMKRMLAYSSIGQIGYVIIGIIAGLYLLVSIGLLTSIVSIYYYLKIIKLLMTERNKEITPHMQNYRRSPLRSSNSIKLSISVCVNSIYHTRNINEPNYCNCS
ncbi:hypothetical protein AMTRI_Chr04g247290 [Amborella trichopoda]